METEIPKPNNCDVAFDCYKQKGCVYNYGDNDKCDYFYRRSCKSKVAQVNALVIELQKLTGKKVELV